MDDDEADGYADSPTVVTVVAVVAAAAEAEAAAAAAAAAVVTVSLTCCALECCHALCAPVALNVVGLFSFIVPIACKTGL